MKQVKMNSPQIISAIYRLCITFFLPDYPLEDGKNFSGTILIVILAISRSIRTEHILTNSLDIPSIIS